MKADRVYCKLQGNRRLHMPSGIYLEIVNAPSDLNFLVSDEMGLNLGFEFHSKLDSSDGVISTYRLIGYYGDRKYTRPEVVAKYDFRKATDEEIANIEHRACLT